MKTIKIIDLLVKIANRKEVPKKIKWRDKIWAYSDRDQDYQSNDNDLFGSSFCNIRTLDFVNDEVEIIEDTPISKLYVNNKLQYGLTSKEYNKIKHIGKIYDITNFKNDYPEVAKLLNDIANKQYEIIDKINYENLKLEETCDITLVDLQAIKDQVEE